MRHGYNSENEIYILSDGTKIRFPYRIYCADNDYEYSQLTDHERLICDCILTRNSDGRIREKHIRNILMSDIPEWCFPYIVRASADYVFEIIEVIYDFLKQRKNSQLQAFCRNNSEIVRTDYRRMYSYWYEYYRRDFPEFSDYIGMKLFAECFLINTSIYNKLSSGKDFPDHSCRRSVSRIPDKDILADLSAGKEIPSPVRTQMRKHHSKGRLKHDLPVWKTEGRPYSEPLCCLRLLQLR